MKRLWKSWLTIVFLLMQFSHSWGGEVVTEEIRVWAKEALKQEGSLKGAPGDSSLAVLYFINKSGQAELDPLQKGFAIMLITDLSSVKGMQIVERVKLQAIMEELGLGSSGIVEPSSAPRVGRLLAAQRLVGGDFSGDKMKLQVGSTLLSVPSAEIVGKSSAEGDLERVFRIEKDLLFQIINLLSIPLAPEEEARLKKPCSANIKALYALFQGIDASDNRQYQKAATLYELALQEDPNICIAGDALNELRDLHLVSAKGPAGAGKKSASFLLLQSVREATSLTNQLTPKEEIRRNLTPRDVPTTTTIDVVFPFDTGTAADLRKRQR